MIGKIMRNTSFRRTTAYALGKPGAKRIGGNMVGQTLDVLVSEFGMSKALNPKIQRPVYHVSLALPYSDSLSDKQFSALADRYLELMGFDRYAHSNLQVRHTDCDHHHIHIIASRINLRTGLVARDSFDRYRSQAAIRQLETEFNLTPTLSSWEVGKRSQSHGQLQVEELTGKESTLIQLQARLDRLAQSEGTLAKSPKTLPEFVADLLNDGIEVKLSRSGRDSGNYRGISYKLGGVAFPGYRLGRRYGLPGLQQHFQISYQPERDNPLLEPANLTQLRMAREQLQPQPQPQPSYQEQVIPFFRSLQSLMLQHDHYLIEGQRYRVTLRSQSSQADDELFEEGGDPLASGDDLELVLYRKEGQFLRRILTLDSQELPSFSILAEQDCKYFQSLADRLRVMSSAMSSGSQSATRIADLSLD